MKTRREFLHKLAASVIAMPLFPFVGEAQGSDLYDLLSTDGPVLRVAIMGLGSYGNRVAEAMLSCTNARLTGVISGTPAKIKDWQAKYNIPDKNCYNYE